MRGDNDGRSWGYDVQHCTTINGRSFWESNLSEPSNVGLPSEKCGLTAHERRHDVTA